jgi:putative toxin-antitoxin system antitoxin component (TIGR02293 family)
MTATSPRPSRTARLASAALTLGAPLLETQATAGTGPAPDLLYRSELGVDAYIKQVRAATPMQIVEMERHGVPGGFIVDLSKRLDLPSSRVYDMLNIPKSTLARKLAAGQVVDGRAGQAAVGMVKLLGAAQELVSHSTAPEAQDFDAVKWLGHWIERPQPALGGRKPADLLDTPTGVELVIRLLGAMQSGTYQ